MDSGQSSKVLVQNLLTAASVNRSSLTADWALVDGADELVYASHRNLIVVRNVGSRHPPAASLIVTPRGPLTVVKFAFTRRREQVPRIIAASSDGFLHLYSRNASSASGWILVKSWDASGSESTKTKQFPGKKSKAEGSASVQALGVLRPSLPWSESDDSIVVSASSDGSLAVWSISNEGVVDHKQTTTLGRARAESKTEVLPLDIALTSLPPSSSGASPLLMAVAGTDGKVDLWLAENSVSFKRQLSIAGHSDWVRSLDFCRVSEADIPTLMLATGSQDATVRLWRLERSVNPVVSKSTKPLDEFERLAMQIQDDTQEETIATKSQSFTCGDARWDASLDALLSGHEHWVTGTRWAPMQDDRQPAALLSSSADNSVIFWTPSSGVAKAVSSMTLPSFAIGKIGAHSASKPENQDVWVSVQRFGDLGSVGSAANGMYGALWHPLASSAADQYQAALAHGYGGAVHLWSRSMQEGQLSGWTAQSGLGGHFAPATCVRWESGGEYFISGGLDKTTRLYGFFQEAAKQSWHELARPQTHGFEIVSLAWLSRLAFASAGDEKIIRVLEAPKGFVQTMKSLNVKSTTAKVAKEKTLIFRLPTLGHLLNPVHLEGPIQEATRQCIADGSKLKVIAISPIFDGIAEGHAPRLSFEQAETFLKWGYSKAWGVAIEAKRLLFEVDILLIGDEAAERFIKSIKDGFFVDEASSSSFKSQPADMIRLSPTSLACPKESKEPVETLPQHRVIALGGTFDHLHVGHKILLSMGALCATEKIIVGVTDDSMLTKKKCAHLLEDIETRKDRASAFLQEFRRPFYDLNRYVVTLKDVAGPPGSDPDVDALLFTDETIGGADFIDKEREKNGLKSLKRLSIGVIGAQGETDLKSKDATELAAAKVGSTAIRQWLDGLNRKIQIPLDKVATLDGQERPLGASVPPLGLSNRSIYSPNQMNEDPASESGQPIGKAQRSIAQHLTRPPVEEELHNNSLWCEVTKMYGHSLELLSLDVDLNTGLIASSCKAKSGQLAVIIIHDQRKGWDEVQQLHGHSLDVTKVRFSQDGKMLASVSRDRTFRIFKKDDKGLFDLLDSQEAHARIIYDVAWSFSGECFATASRDNTVKVWTVDGEKPVQQNCTLQVKEPVTAVAFTTEDRLAVGTEKGNLFIYSRVADSTFSLLAFIPALHSEAISELAWRPISLHMESGDDSSKGSFLASSSLDGSVRLSKITQT